MEWYGALVLMLGIVVAFLLVGVPVVIAFFVANIAGAILFLGGDAGLAQMMRNAQEAVAKFTLAPIPLFVLMGEIMYQTRLAAQAIDAIDRLFAKVPGRLSLVSIVAGVIFASLSGSTIANTAMLGSTLMPEMLRRGYHPKMAMGPIMAVGGVAMLIPPSALAVLLGSLAHIPIAELLIAGILPGVMMGLLFFGYVVVRCTVSPSLAPTYEAARLSGRERWLPFLTRVVPLLLIFVVVVGSIVFGVATPTESAALGAIASVVAAWAYRCLTWQSLLASVRETVKISTIILFIICGSITFSQILAFSGATAGLTGLVLQADLGLVAILAGMILVLLFLGCFMDQVSMMMITLPIFMPVLTQAGVDVIWFGVLMLLTLEISLLTPPFGLLLFTMKGVAPIDVPIGTVINAAMPFIILELVVLAILFAWPPLTAVLPALIRV